MGIMGWDGRDAVESRFAADLCRGRRHVCDFSQGGERFYKPFYGNGQQTETESIPHVEGVRNFLNQFSVTTNNC
jgi:hypothetical protein